jgi:hypothetical protein
MTDPRGIRLCAAYKVFNGETYLASSLRSIYDAVDRIVIFLSTRPWNGPIVPPDSTEAIIRGFPDPQRKITCVVRDFRYEERPEHQHANELREMNALLDFVRTELIEITHYLYIDADEVHTPSGIAALCRLLRAMPEAGEVYCAWRCYWKSFAHWIDPLEPSRALAAFRIAPETRFVGIRATNMHPRIRVSPDHFLLHHFSYALSAALVQRKIQAWSHCDDVVEGWFDRVWLGWDRDRTMENLHPVRPPHFTRAVPAVATVLPEVMRTHPFFGRDIV